MKILIDICHPKDVNVLKNIIFELEKRNHKLKILVRPKDNTKELFETYNFDYELGKHYNGMLNKAVGMLKNDIWIYKISKKFNPDLFVSMGSPYCAQISKLLRKRHIAFVDTEIASLVSILMVPFTDVVCIPSCFQRHLGSNEVRFDSYFELTYLHPNNFKTNPYVLDELHISQNERYIIMRISNLKSSHDLGVKGLNFKSEDETIEFIKEIEKFGRVFISSEKELSKKLEKYRIKVHENDFHSFCFYASMYIGDGATMAAESAILGVPSIYVSTTRRGYLDELEKKYGLVYNINNRNDAIIKIREIFKEGNEKSRWAEKRTKLLAEKFDPLNYLVDLIESSGIPIK